MLKPGDEITVVVQNGKSIVRARVRGFVFDDSPARVEGAVRFGWDTAWQASGYCYEGDEGVTWVPGYVNEPACRALLVAYAFGKNTTASTARQKLKLYLYGLMYGRKAEAE